MVESFQKMADKEGCDIAIIDILMPHQDGYDLVRRIKELPPPYSEVPLLAFSSSFNSQIRQYKEAGFDGFLPKPIHPRKLLGMIRRLLAANGGGSRQEIQTQYSIAEDQKHSVHILLAEDNPINQKLARYLLTQAGYRLSIAGNGQQAVEMIEKEPDKYHLVLMDVQMPVLDGREATRRLRAAGYTEIPIIAMTAESLKGDREKCLKAGMNDYISKPIKREKIFRLIKKWCLETETSSAGTTRTR
jgi:CheY-like chemotaxis protein